MPLAHLSPTGSQVLQFPQQSPQQKQIPGKGLPRHSGLSSSPLTIKMRPPMPGRLWADLKLHIMNYQKPSSRGCCVVWGRNLQRTQLARAFACQASPTQS